MSAAADHRRPWTRAMTGFARRMRKAGRTFGWIARALGVSRETCVSEMARAGVLYRPRAARRRVASAGEAAPETLGDLHEILGEGACHWIDGDPRTNAWRMCGQPCVRRSAWCAHHTAKAHRAMEGQDGV